MIIRPSRIALAVAAVAVAALSAAGANAASLEVQPTPAVQHTEVAPQADNAGRIDEFRALLAKTEDFARRVIGMNIDEAIALADRSGFVIRITVRDGVSHSVTMDLQSNRVNAVVIHDVITETSVG